MAEDSLTERSFPFNQLSPSSRSSTAFQPSERIAKLELMATLLAQAEALSVMHSVMLFAPLPLPCKGIII